MNQVEINLLVLGSGLAGLPLLVLGVCKYGNKYADKKTAEYEKYFGRPPDGMSVMEMRRRLRQYTRG